MVLIDTQNHRTLTTSVFCSSTQLDEAHEEFRKGEIDRYDSLATAMQRIGAIGIWEEKPLLSGNEIKSVLPNIPKGPAFREVMEEQERWMVLHPGASSEILTVHLLKCFPDYI